MDDINPYEFCEVLYLAPDGTIVLGGNVKFEYDYAQIVEWAHAHPDQLVPLPPPALGDQEEAARAERDRLLSASDWTQVADAPVDRAAWAAYRQALRDWPEAGTGFPDVATLPEQPHG